MTLHTPPPPVPDLDADAPPEDPRFRQMRRLVNMLLIVMIIAVMVVAFALVLKLRDLPSIGVAALRPSEQIVATETTPDRIALTLRDAETGASRVILLDATSFKPIAVINGRETR